MSQQLEMASNLWNGVDQAVQEGQIKVNDSGQVSVVEDPGERAQIASASKIRRRKADVHGLQLDDESVNIG